jgi:putative inorganic carbon (hco3(-)) transporter
VTAAASELAGMIVGCGAAALGLVARDPRLRLGALALALVVAPTLFLGSVWDEPRIIRFREEGATVAAATVGAVVLIAGLAVLFRRFPMAFPILAFASLPLRVPVDVGGEQANLLIPLYAVIAAAAAAAIWTALSEQGAGMGRPTGQARTLAWPPSNAAGWLRWLLAATLLLYAGQSAYTEDLSNAIEIAAFFLIPFAVLFSLLLDVRWNQRLLGLVLAGVATMAALLAGIALYQYAARDLFLNEELLASNQLHQYFRVNSLFYDPNILGRYLALAVTALAAYIAWGADRRLLAIAASVAGLGLAGLAFSFSITSFAALLGGLATLALLRWRLRGGAAAAGLGAGAIAALLLIGGAPASDVAYERGGLDSGRGELISGGVELAEARPVAGWGSGSFGAAFSERIQRGPTTVSHSEPVTVAAEQGAIGLAVYLPLLAVALIVLFGAFPAASSARSAVAACFVVMLVHSIGYAGFTIDPATWALLSVGVALRR